MPEPDKDFDEGPVAPELPPPGESGRALARMAEGVAHVIRNPLTGIAAGVDFLGRSLASDPVHAENVQAVRREVERLNGIIEDMLVVTHPPALNCQVVESAEIFSELGRLFQDTFPGLKLMVADGPPHWQGDAGEIRRALWELLKNAAQASGEGQAVRVSVHEVGGGGQGHAPSDWIAIRIRDSGSGLAPSVCRGLFEPFRTTRAGHKGLGLFIAHDIALRHGGTLTVEEAPEKGVQTTMFLPWSARS